MVGTSSEEPSAEIVEEIREAFSQLSPDEAKTYYTVEPGDDGDFYFSWPMYAVKARRL